MTSIVVRATSKGRSRPRVSSTVSGREVHLPSSQGRTPAVSQTTPADSVRRAERANARLSCVCMCVRRVLVEPFVQRDRPLKISSRLPCIFFTMYFGKKKSRVANQLDYREFINSVSLRSSAVWRRILP